MSHLLVRAGKPPFVLTVENAKAYFDPSTLMKQMKKDSLSMWFHMSRLKKRFAAFLAGDVHPRHLHCRASVDRVTR